MEVVVLDIRNHSLGKHVLVVLLTSVSGICDDFTAVQTVFLMEGFQKVDKRSRIRRPLENAVIGDELILGGDLYVVSGFELPVEHGILLHAHECGIRIALGV